MKTEKEELLDSMGLTEKEFNEIYNNISDYKRGFADATIQQIEIMKKDKFITKQYILDEIDKRINHIKINGWKEDYDIGYIRALEFAQKIIKSEFGGLEDDN